MSALAREHPDPEDYEAALDAMEDRASRCPHGEAHWKDCESCCKDEFGVRVWERSRDK